MQPTYPSSNNPNRFIHPGVCDNISRPLRMIDPRLASHNVNRFDSRLGNFQTESRQFPLNVPQTAMVSPILRPPAMHCLNHSVYSNMDVRSQSQNLSFLTQHSVNLADNQWNNDVHQFNVNLTQSWPSKIQEKLDKLANKFKDMIEYHKKLVRKRHRPQINENNEDEVCACLPPIETFTGVDKLARKSHFYDYLEKGDLLCVQILDHLDGGFICVVLCMDGGKRRTVHDCDIKVFCPSSNCQPLAVTDSEFQDGYQINDIVRVLVVSYSKFDLKVIVSMKEEHLPKELRGNFKMGLINDDELPIHYRRQVSIKSMNYDEMLRKTLSFNNPGATSHLAGFFELPTIQRLSFLRDFHGVTYPKDEYAKHLRKFQSTVMARQSVEEGVKFLKSGCHVEAQQCLNKALQIDCDNLDALVARGCLYANTNNLMKAAEDFDKALSINPEHVNARKYMSETLFELGKICEEKGDLESAAKNYRRVCQIDTKNHEALEALKSVIEKKRMQRSCSPHNDLKSMLQDIKDKSYYESSYQLKTLLEEDKKKKKKSNRRRSSSSSSSSSSSDTSSSSSSSLSSSSSGSDSSTSLSSKRKSRRRKKSRKSKSKKSKRKKDKKKKSRSIKPLPGIKISKSKGPEKPIVNSEPSTSRVHAKKNSPKISFTLKKNEPEIKTLKSAKPFAFSSKAGSPKRNPITEKIVYNLDKLKPVSIEFVRNGLLNEKSNESKTRKPSPRRVQNQSRMYIPGRSRSRSRSRSTNRRRRSRSRSRSRSRAICRAVLRKSSRSPRGQNKVRDDPFRERPSRRSPSKERSSSSRGKSRPNPKDAFKKAAEEAKKVEAVITNQNSVQKQNPLTNVTPSKDRK